MDIIQNINIADICDILIVAIFIYVGLTWFKRTRTILIVVGIVILGVVYAFARFFNLFLTTAILQGFFAVLLIAIIVMFQEELRRFFERVALWGLGRRSQPIPMALALTFARTAIDLSRERVGAIIVLTGRDPLERHVEGGHILDGKPSESLLRSIFDPHSPGHDGALIVREGKVVKFAAHLPLSRDLKKLSNVGTRHAAALGLAERCDALCIVISEERGTVSIARDGKLDVLSDPSSQLEPIIENFWKEKFPLRHKRKLARIIAVNKREKIAALLLSLGLWLAFAQGEGMMQRDFVIPLEYSNLAPQLVVERAMPRRLTVTISGEERAFKLLDPTILKATLDLEHTQTGKKVVPIHKEDVVRVPRGLTLESVHPSEVELLIEEIKLEKEKK